MLDLTIPATVTPYFGPWTVVDQDGALVISASSQDEAIRVARAQLPVGAILAIDAGACVVRFVVPAASSVDLN